MKNLKIVVDGLNWPNGHEMALPDDIAKKWVEEGKAVYIDRVTEKSVKKERIENKAVMAGER